LKEEWRHMTGTCSGSCGHLCEIIVNPTPNCNLKCSYCYDAWRQPDEVIKMEENVWDGIRNLVDSLGQKEITFAFLGGEPAFLGVEYFERFEEYWADITHKSHIQTNATLLDDEFCTFLKEHKYTVGTSLDGVPEVHNKARDGSFTESLRGITLAKEYGILNKILSTITNDSMPYIEETFELFALIGVQTHFNAGSPDLLPANYHIAMRKLYEMWSDFGEPFYGIQFTRLRRKIEKKEWHDSSAPKMAGCMGGAVQIDYNGVVAMCSQLSGHSDYICGNVLTDHPVKIMLNKNRFRFWNKTKEIRERCHKCYFRFICSGGCYFNALSSKLDYDPYCLGGAGMYRAALDRAGMAEEYAEFVRDASGCLGDNNQPVRLKPQGPNVRLRQDKEDTRRSDQ